MTWNGLTTITLYSGSIYLELEGKVHNSEVTGAQLFKKPSAVNELQILCFVYSWAQVKINIVCLLVEVDHKIDNYSFPI